MRERMEESARRLLVNAFHLGLFENPYVDPDEAEKIVGNPAYMQAGYEAQQKSVVMLKNRDHVLPLQRKTRVYIPKQYTPGSVAWTGDMIPESWNLPVSEDLVNMYFELVKTPEEADAAICFMRQPGAGLSLSRGYSLQDRENGGNGYMPISLQYRPYTAVDARKTSIAGGDPLEPFTNRSYKGKTVTTENEKDLDMLLETREAMGGKPVIAVLNTTAPVVCHEFEEASDAILVSFGQVDQAVLDIASGGYEPSGLLPMQMPANMKTVEEQMEDVPFDMECHVDSEGHSYDFGFGMNWNGVIQDERTRKYGRNE